MNFEDVKAGTCKERRLFRMWLRQRLHRPRLVVLSSAGKGTALILASGHRLLISSRYRQLLRYLVLCDGSLYSVVGSLWSVCTSQSVHSHTQGFRTDLSFTVGGGRCLGQKLHLRSATALTGTCRISSVAAPVSPSMLQPPHPITLQFAVWLPRISCKAVLNLSRNGPCR